MEGKEERYATTETVSVDPSQAREVSRRKRREGWILVNRVTL